MALVLKDRVQETSTTSGTGTLTLSGAVSGFQTFSTAIGNGNTTFYTIYDNTAYVWEVGIGTVGAGTLARTTVLSNSSGTTSPISFAGNSKFVFCTYPSEKSINYDANDVATIGEVLGYSDTGIVGSFTSTVAGYNQVIVQNKSTATNASSNLNVSNDAGTAGSNYAELGINSSTFTGSGSFNIAGASYVASASTDLTIGTYGAYSVHFVTNSSTTDSMTIFNNGGISLGGFANPGIGNMAASKFVPGYTGITSAAGTTVLTASSNYYQNLLGTTTQTFRLPDATTLLVGTTFIFDNDSTGTLTVTDNATATIETIPGGAAGFVYLADNSTVAGTWRKHAFLPATYDFNNTTANFGNATITNAVWNGTTIASGYGGTGLTTFTGANNALYSTGASTLTAGTLPVAAGGSGAVTFTANGVLYGSGTSALGVTAAGTTGQVLIGNTGAAPSWGTVSSSLVSSFSAGTTGLTPNTATTGAVTLGGTLDVDNGGTGQTTYTNGQLLIGNTTGNTLTKATLTGTASQVDVTNGAGSITLSLPATINVNTSGSAATLTTSRDIYGNSFNGSANVTGIIASTYGGTGNGFTKFSGPTTSEKTFTLPNASATILTDNAAITPTQGGTGLTTYTTGDIIYASATNTLSKLADVATGNALISGGVGVAPLWGKIGLTTHVSGTLPVANGGTGATTATAAFDALSPTTTVGDIIYEATGPTATRLGIGTTGQVLTVSGGIPSWATPTTGTVTTVGFTGGLISVATATTTPALTVAGTSGGIVYFSSASTWASSAALAASSIVLGGGAGAAPATTTTGAGVVTALGIAVNSGAGGLVTNTGTATLTNKTLTSPVIGTIVNTGTLTLPTSTDTLVGRATTDTLTNKRITPRVTTTTSSATPSINTDTTDQFGLTAQAVNITSFTTSLTGTPTNGQKLWIYIVGTAARTITWGASFESSTVTLPTTTVSTNRLDVGFVWNAVTSKWRCVAVA